MVERLGQFIVIIGGLITAAGIEGRLQVIREDRSDEASWLPVFGVLTLVVGGAIWVFGPKTVLSREVQQGDGNVASEGQPGGEVVTKPKAIEADSAKQSHVPLVEDYDDVKWEERRLGLWAKGPLCPEDETILDFFYGDGRSANAEEHARRAANEIERITNRYYGKQSLHDVVGYQGSYLWCPTCKQQYLLGPKPKSVGLAQRHATAYIVAKRKKIESGSPGKTVRLF